MDYIKITKYSFTETEIISSTHKRSVVDQGRSFSDVRVLTDRSTDRFEFYLNLKLTIRIGTMGSMKMMMLT